MTAIVNILIFYYSLNGRRYDMETLLKWLADFICSVASNNANTTCNGPFYELEEPFEVSNLRK